MATAVAVVTLIAYFPSLANDFVNWDDPVNILDNVHIRSLGRAFFAWALTDRSLSYWQPLNWLTHALDYAVWKLDPFGHHLTNILIHAATAFTVVCLSVRLQGIILRIRDPEMAGSLPASRRGHLLVAGVTGLLFGLHPLNVESVSWVTGRPGMLSALFYLLCLYAYLGHRFERSWALYFLSLLLFICSLTSKPMAMTLPAVLLLLEWHISGMPGSVQDIRRLVVRIVPFGLLAVSVATVAVLSEKVDMPEFAAVTAPLLERILVSARAVMAYLQKIIVPINLTPYYEYPGSVSIFSIQYLAAVLAVIGITAGSLIHRQRKVLFSIWAFFIITLLPVLGFVTVRSVFMADRYMYLSLIGPLFLAGLGAEHVWRRFEGQVAGRRLLAGCAVVLLSLMTFMTVKQEAVWKSGMTLWSYIIDQRECRYPIAYHNRSLLYFAAADFSRALEDASRALALNPAYADAYHNRGNVLTALGEYDRAIADYDRAISLKQNDAVLYNCRGLAYVGKGDLNRALKEYDKAIALQPDYSGVYNNRGLAYAAQGKFDLAERDYTAAIGLNPAAELAANVRSNRGIIRAGRREYRLALDDFNAALALSPGSAALLNNRGALHLLMGEPGRAAEDFSAACSQGSAVGCDRLQSVSR